MKHHIMILSFFGAVAFALLPLLTRCATSTTGPGGDDAQVNDNHSGQVDNGGADVDDGDTPDGGVTPDVPEDPLPDYVPDPDIYVAAFDPDLVVTLEPEGEDGPILQFPVNQMILLMEQGAPRADAEAVAELLGGAIVGQVPAMDFYQLELPTTTQAELDEALAQAQDLPSVEAVSYSVLVAPLQCPSPSDLYDQLFLGEERCPFVDVDYYNALTIFDQIRPMIALHPVVVAVIDSGIQKNNGEFDEISIVNLSDPNVDSTDREGHGTAVAALIASDDDGAGICGLASRMLDNTIVLLDGNTAATAFPDSYAATQRAVAAGAEVVNMSFGSSTRLSGVSDISAIRASWRRLFEANPDVLFVAAADNHPYEITAENFAPGGLNLPNVITVGGLNICEPMQAYPSSAFGPRVEVAAPAVNVPTADRIDGHHVIAPSGNSAAVPIVVSLAAILKSIDPSLTPQEIKDDYIRYYGVPAAESVSGIRPYFSSTIMQVLIDRFPSVPYEVLDLIDDDINDHHDLVTMVVNRICGGLQYTVMGYGSYDYTGEEVADPAVPIVGRIAPQAFTLESAVTEDAHLLVACLNGIECSFELGKAYPIHREALDIPGYVAVTYQIPRENDVPEYVGLGISGSVVFDECRIDERYPVTNDIAAVGVTGGFSGALEVVHLDSSKHYVSLEGAFGIPFISTMVGMPNEPVIEYLEANCEGGIPILASHFSE
ncbi:MAG: S8/S53 family peptidase [Phycisphaerales bacterium]|nr:MAG: S8/S53 family peptidase [Phycisphaerales bacterium]